LGIWNSDNLPPKSNFQKRRGFEAVTGKSKFDISEWMLLQHREDGDELFELVSRTESLVRQQGLYPEAQVDLERRLAQVAEEQAHARPNERLLGSSEVIESVLGK